MTDPKHVPLHGKIVNLINLIPTFALLLLLSKASVRAEPFNPPRWADDFGKAAEEWPKGLPQIKEISIGRPLSARLNLGGELRSEFNLFHNANWGAGPQDDNGYLLWRWQTFADLRAERWRIFAQIKGTGSEGQDTPPAPVDRNLVDLHELFGEFPCFSLAGGEVTLRLGRQELPFGSQRLMSYREGPNNRLSFDAARLWWHAEGARFDLFAGAPLEVDLRSFDDQKIRGSSVSGAYSTLDIASQGRASLDLYALYSTQDQVRYSPLAPGDEGRLSFGARFFGRTGALDYDVESVFQTGEWGEQDIFAWTFASDIGYTWGAVPTRPRLGFKAAVASGDDDPLDGRLNTFNALYPRGTYFGPSATIGPANLINVHPYVTLKLSPQVTAQAELIFFWRESIEDGIYSPSRQLIRAPATSLAREVGTQLNLQLAWQPDPRFQVTFEYEFFAAGRFIEETGPADDSHYLSAKVHLRY